MSFDVLFTPIRIGGIELRNRLVMPSMGSQLPGPDGSMSPYIRKYLEERAKGGVALILPGHTYVGGGGGKGMANQSRADSDSLVPDMARLADAVHAHGARIFLQLNHCGRQTGSEVAGEPIVAPSAVPSIGGEVPKELTVAEIEEIVQAFGKAARRAMQAGIDGVELHGAHGYLIGQFLSDYVNRRTDRYGGSFEKRLTFAREVYRVAREMTDPDFPIGLRLNADDMMDVLGEEYRGRGITLDESPKIAREMEKEGVCYIHISTSIGDNFTTTIQSPYVGRNLNIERAAAIKAAVDIPVIVVGSINEPDDMVSIIEGGKADMIALGRTLVADPEVPNKIREGRVDEIRKCILCNWCYTQILSNRPLGCAVNVMAGRETKEEFAPLEHPKRVMVVGGGPAGISAALTAARRGHSVTLYEREGEVGGNLWPASGPDFKREIGQLISYYQGELKRSKVSVQTSTEVTADLVRRESPDVVILATGSRSIESVIEDADQERVYLALDVLRKARSVEGDRVVVVGGGMVGSETALYLAREGKDVTIVEMLDEILVDETNIFMHGGLEISLQQAGVEVRTGLKASRVTETCIEVEDEAGQCLDVEADAVVLAIGLRPDQELQGALKELGIPVHAVGDCVKPQRIGEAIHEGYRVANFV